MSIENTAAKNTDEILARSAAWSQAIVANEPDEIGKYMADDWVLVSEHGMLTKESFLSLVRSGQLAHESMDMAELGAVTLYGDAAILVSRVESVAIFGGQKFPANEWTSDVFVKMDGEWKCVKTHLTPVLKVAD